MTLNRTSHEKTSKLTPTPEVLGQLIAAARRAEGLTQAQLGERMGVRQATVSKLERDPRACRLDTLFRALSALRLELELSNRASFDEAPW